MLSCPPPPFDLFLFVVECFSQSSACLFSMNDKNNAHVDRSFSYMRLESEESMDPTDEDVRREKEKVSNMVSIEDSTFSAMVKVRKRKFSLEMVVYLILWSFQKVHPFKFDHIEQNNQSELSCFNHKAAFRLARFLYSLFGNFTL